MEDKELGNCPVVMVELESVVAVLVVELLYVDLYLPGLS